MIDQNKRALVGQRDRRVQVVEYTTIKNSLNEDVKTEQSVGYFYARVDDLSGTEDEEGKVIHIINRMYVIPYHPDIKARGEHMVVKDEEREYRIYYVQEVGRHEQLRLKCTNRE